MVVHEPCAPGFGVAVPVASSSELTYSLTAPDSSCVTAMCVHCDSGLCCAASPRLALHTRVVPDSTATVVGWTSTVIV